MNAPAILVCLAAATAIGCGSSNQTEAEPPAPVETSDAVKFCRDFYAAICDHLELCSCEPAIVSSCRAYRCDGPLFDGADDPISRGTLVFDPLSADALFARLRDPGASCQGLYADTGLDSYSANSLGGVFRGTLPEGSSCSLSSSKQKPGPTDCAAGLACLPDDQGRDRCVKLAKPGEACSLIPENPGSNCLLQQGPDSDNEFESAFDGLVCVPNGASGSEGTCATNAANGVACDDASQCASRRCVPASGRAPGLCGQKLSAGSPCDASLDCETNYCGTRGSSGVCTPQAADGAECSEDAACRSGTCEPGGGAGVNICVTPAATTPLPLGSACGTSQACESTYCYESRCAPRVCSMFD